jgi:transcriptional regulator with XRE-family HTH domain
MSEVGDLGRRVAERRSDLELTIDEVAQRSGMSATYLRVVESNPAPQLSRAALWKLAAALETSVDAITGSGMEAPPGREPPSERPILEVLSVDESRAMMAPGGVGRLIVDDDRGPVALPVNFRMLDGDVIFRTEPDSTFLADLVHRVVSFEVDHLDDSLSEGWSVLLTGHGRVIIDPAEVAMAQSLGIAPWAGGERGIYVRLVPGTTTGRRIRQRAGDGS